jgi:hypothetical protein
MNCPAMRSRRHTLFSTAITRCAASTKLGGRAREDASAGVQVGDAFSKTAVSRDRTPACGTTAQVQSKLRPPAHAQLRQCCPSLLLLVAITNQCRVIKQQLSRVCVAHHGCCLHLQDNRCCVWCHAWPQSAGQQLIRWAAHSSNASQQPQALRHTQ